MQNKLPLAYIVNDGPCLLEIYRTDNWQRRSCEQKGRHEEVVTNLRHIHLLRRRPDPSSAHRAQNLDRS